MAGGQFGYRKGHVWLGGTFGNWGLLVEGVHVRSDGFKQLDGGGDTGFSRTDVMVKGRYRFDTAHARHAFSLKLGYGNEASDETYVGLTDADFRENPLRRYWVSGSDRMTWDRTQVALSHRYRRERAVVQTTLYRNDFQRDWLKVNNGIGNETVFDVLRRPEGTLNRELLSYLKGENNSGSIGVRIGNNGRTFVSQGVQTVATVKLGDRDLRQTLDFGARLHMDSLDRLQDEGVFTVDDATGVPGDARLAGGPRAVKDNDRTETTALAFFASDALEFSRKLTLSPTLRVERIWTRATPDVAGATSDDTVSTGSYWAFLPGAGVNYKVARDLYLLGGIYRGFSPAPRVTKTPRSSRVSITSLASGFKIVRRGWRPLGFGTRTAILQTTLACPMLPAQKTSTARRMRAGHGSWVLKCLLKNLWAGVNTLSHSI